MSDVTNPYWDSVEQILMLFYPQFFDPESPDYVDPAILEQLDLIAQEARPWCLPVNHQNMAEAMYLAYLISLRTQSSSGQAGGGGGVTAGPIISEKEGDIQITYASPTSGSKPSGMSDRPSSDPWDAWNRLWLRCARGGITTRYGDPCRSMSSAEFTTATVNRALGVWRYSYG